MNSAQLVNLIIEKLRRVEFLDIETRPKIAIENSRKLSKGLNAMQPTKNEEQYEEQFQMDFTPQDVVLTAILVGALFLSAFGILFGAAFVVSSIVQLIR